MGALFFMGLMAVLFFIAVFFIIVCVVIIIVWSVRRRKGKKPRKWWLIVPIVVLILSIAAALIPVGYMGFLRLANSSVIHEVEPAESGVMIYWPLEGNDSFRGWFELDGEKYVYFDEHYNSEDFSLSFDGEALDAPVANIKFDPSTSNFLNEIMTFLGTGQSADKLNVSAIYPVINDNGFNIYVLKGEAGTGIYCLESEIGVIKNTIPEYYSDFTNYDMQHLVCKYSVYPEGGGRYDKIEYEVAVDAGMFEELYELYNSSWDYVDIKIPQKYIDIKNTEAPGTSVYGYEKRELCAYSKDKAAYIPVYLVLIDEQVYFHTRWYYENDDGYTDVCPLPEEMNQYLLETVFADL